MNEQLCKFDRCSAELGVLAAEYYATYSLSDLAILFGITFTGFDQDNYNVSS